MKNKIGLIGCGRWGRNILRDLLRLECEVYVADLIDKNRLDAIEIGATKTFDDYMNFPDVDGFVVVVETINHHKVLMNLLRSKKPIFCEKPLTNTLSQTEQLLALAPDSIFVMHKWRYHSGIQKLAEITSSGKYGKALHLDIERKQFGIPHKDVDATFILMPHDLSIALTILGYLPSLKESYGNYDEDGSIHYLNTRLGSNPSCKIEVSDRFVKYHRLVHVQLEQASLFLENPLDENIIVKEIANEQIKVPINTEFPLLRELKAFLNYLNGGEKPLTSLEEEYAIMKTLVDSRSQILK